MCFWSHGGAYVEGNAEGKVEGNAGGNAEGNAKGNAKGNAEGNAGGIFKPLFVYLSCSTFMNQLLKHIINQLIRA
jgi:hypothetical protein